MPFPFHTIVKCAAKIVTPLAAKLQVTGDGPPGVGDFKHFDFVSFSVALGAWTRWAPLDPHLTAMAPHPPVNTYMCIPTEFKDDICTDYLKKANSTCSPAHGQKSGRFLHFLELRNFVP